MEAEQQLPHINQVEGTMAPREMPPGSLACRSSSTTVVPREDQGEFVSLLTSGTAEESNEKAHTKTRSSKGKQKADKRLKWSNAMVAELLCLRFRDDEVKNRIDSADTKIKKALAWQFFASKLSQALGLVITQDQVYQKYRKLKCIYQKEKREMKKTGDITSSLKEVDDQLWDILTDAFSSKGGLSGETLLDTNAEQTEGSSDEVEVNGAPAASPGKLAPVVQLAQAMESGMTAIAAAMGSRPANDDHFRALANAMEQQTRALEVQQQETRRFQELQLQLMQRLLDKTA